jgi:hypothetical protein
MYTISLKNFHFNPPVAGLANGRATFERFVDFALADDFELDPGLLQLNYQARGVLLSGATHLVEEHAPEQKVAGRVLAARIASRNLLQGVNSDSHDYSLASSILQDMNWKS